VLGRDSGGSPHMENKPILPDFRFVKILTPNNLLGKLLRECAKRSLSPAVRELAAVFF